MVLHFQKAIELIREHFETEHVDLYTDSQYSYNIFTSWAKKWKANGWVKADKKPILNLDLIKRIYDAIHNRGGITFHHCNSHMTPPTDMSSEAYKIWHGNDQADKLANLMIPTQRQSTLL